MAVLGWSLTDPIARRVEAAARQQVTIETEKARPKIEAAARAEVVHTLAPVVPLVVAFGLVAVAAASGPRRAPR